MNAFRCIFLIVCMADSLSDPVALFPHHFAKQYHEVTLDNVSYNSTPIELVTFCRQIGEVVRCQYVYSAGRFTGVAVVAFKHLHSVSTLEECAKLEALEFKGRKLYVKPPQARMPTNTLKYVPHRRNGNEIVPIQSPAWHRLCITSAQLGLWYDSPRRFLSKWYIDTSLATLAQFSEKNPYSTTDSPAARAIFNFDRRVIEWSNPAMAIAVQIPFTGLRGPILVDWSPYSGTFSLFLTLRHPPRVFANVPVEGGVNNNEEWSAVPIYEPTRIVGDYQLWGPNLVHCLTFSREYSDDIRALINGPLAAYGLVDVDAATPPVTVLTKRDLRPYIRLEGLFQTLFPVVDYRVLYTLAALVSTGLIVEENLDEEFVDILLSTHADVLVAALEKLYLEGERVYQPTARLRQLQKEFAHYLPRMNDIVPSHSRHVIVRRVVITPTRLMVLLPQLELSNRVLRHFASHADRFLRVKFADEDQSTLGGLQLGRQSELLARIRVMLEEGFSIACRKYEFLAFSASQLREHGCWFFAPGEGSTPPNISLDVRSIHAWMGDFRPIITPAKCAARMGQCFSATKDAAEVSAEGLCEIPDVANDKYVFSDGVGVISTELAKRIAVQLGFDHVPSAYQIRLGGIKGVLVAWPSLPPHHPASAALASSEAHQWIFYRPSMKKFESSHRRIEVVNVAGYIPLFLNRQVITILSSLGVHNAMFEQMQDDMVRALTNMLTDREACIAFLTNQSNAASFEAGGGWSAGIIHVLRAGISLDEPYIQQVLRVLRQNQLKMLKTKTRCYVAKGRQLLGVMDETATLEYGQVYVQYSLPPGAVQGTARTVILPRGTLVVVAKNPCFHPGDIRVLTAVGPTDVLDHLRDVVVFPCKGPRPHPNECSGSDLDGDVYWVCWDERLVPPLRNRNLEPMDFSAKPSPAGYGTQPVTLGAIKSFFVDYVQNDQLGVIANAHLAVADQTRGGVFSEKCLRLAQLHSIAVDFPKTGVPAEFPRELRVKEFPDFMEKKDRPSYPSLKILGRLYRKVAAEYQASRITSLSWMEINVDKSLLSPGWQDYADAAAAVRDEYAFYLQRIMNVYEVTTEAEAVMGCITTTARKSRKKTSKLFVRQKELREAVAHLRQTFRTMFEEEFKEHAPTHELLHKRRAKASAWYYATYLGASARIASWTAALERGDEIVECPKLFLSLPWLVVPEIMGEIMAENRRARLKEATSPAPVDTPITEEKPEEQKVKQKESITPDVAPVAEQL